MDEALKTTKTVYPVSQFLDWQRGGTLNLSPIFQRRLVWKRPAKSLLIDSVLRGYPLPIVLLRQVQDLQDLSTKMEVIDGQQRLRTLLSYIDPDCLPSSDVADNYVTILRTHNREFAGTPFAALPEEVKRLLLGYPGAGGLAQSSILLVNTHSPWIADWMPAPEDRRHAERWK